MSNNTAGSFVLFVRQKWPCYLECHLYCRNRRIFVFRTSPEKIVGCAIQSLGQLV